MIDYHTYHKIHHLHQHENLNNTQIAHQLQLNPDTVTKWLATPHYHPRQSNGPRPSKLDPFKKQILHWLEHYPYSAQQIYQRLKPLGFDGSYTIVKEHLRKVRPPKSPNNNYLKLHFQPGDAAQVDWGECGKINVSGHLRKLYVLVILLCHSRLLHLQFALSMSMEHFLHGHIQAFQHFQGVPRRLIVDNLKTAVLDHHPGQQPNYNPRYLDFAAHYGFAPIACNVRKPNEKGRVERGVDYVKTNFLAGHQIHDYQSLQTAAEQWRDEIANKRTHRSTQRIPQEHYEQEEKAQLLPLRQETYDCGTDHYPRQSKDNRVTYQTNEYSLPPNQSAPIRLRAYPEQILLYNATDQLLVTHPRHYGKHQDIEDPQHTQALKDQRHRAREQTLMHDFHALGPIAITYHARLKEHRVNDRSHLRRILALTKIYPKDQIIRVLQDGLDLDAISADYVAHMLEIQARMPGPNASPLHLTRHADQLDLTTPEPDLTIYNQPKRPKPKA